MEVGGDVIYGRGEMVGEMVWEERWRDAESGLMVLKEGVMGVGVGVEVLYVFHENVSSP